MLVVVFIEDFRYDLSMRISDKKRIALVLSGGGVKAAAFHLGVCLALREKGFKFAGGSKHNVEAHYSDDRMTFKVYVGSSAGAFISTMLASGHEIEMIIDAFERGAESPLNKLLKRRPKDSTLKALTYADMFSINGSNIMGVLPNLVRGRSLMTSSIEALIKSGFKINGIFTTKGMERYIRENVVEDNQFSSLGVDLFIVATQLNHSRKIVFGNFPETSRTNKIKYGNFATISDAVAASTALPPVFAPYGIKNQKGKEIQFFDGEIRETLSTHVAADLGADLVISSYSIQPYHYNSEMGSLHEYGIPVIVNQALYQVVQQKIEKHIEHEQQISAILKAVDGYFHTQGLPEEHREKIRDIIVKRTGYKTGVDYLYIHPSPDDHEFFFADHFSLNAEVMTRIVQSGFRAAIKVLRKLDM